MKTQYTFIILLLAVCFGLSSCKKFLKETSQDEVRPETVEDLQQTMYSEAYPYLLTVDSYTDLLTDDVQCNVLYRTATTQPNASYLTYLRNGTKIFSWDPSMFDNISNAAGTITADLGGVNSWRLYYSKIKGCNVILDYIDKVSGSAQIKNNTRGQALFLRAFYYLRLVTLYAQPYSGSGIDTSRSLGVPLILSATVSDVFPARNTLAEVYHQIEKDLLEAAKLLDDNSSVFRVNKTTAYALLSRMYLYKGRDQDMDNVVRYASQALALNPKLTQLTSYITMTSPNLVLNLAGIYDQSLSQEVIWSYGPNPKNANIFITGAATPFSGLGSLPYTASQSLADIYERGTTTNYQGDLRYFAYITRYISLSVQYLWGSGKIGQGPNYGNKGIRVAELYLNRAEGLIRRYKKNGQSTDMVQALSDLNTLRQSRFDTRNVPYTPVNITDPDQLFKFCQDERRRELCLEDSHRWIDIKRWGLSVTHTYYDEDGNPAAYTLPSGSLLYALPIPYDVVQRNGNLQQNPR